MDKQGVSVPVVAVCNSIALIHPGAGVAGLGRPERGRAGGAVDPGLRVHRAAVRVARRTQPRGTKETVCGGKIDRLAISLVPRGGSDPLSATGEQSVTSSPAALKRRRVGGSDRLIISFSAAGLLRSALRRWRTVRRSPAALKRRRVGGTDRVGHLFSAAPSFLDTLDKPRDTMSRPQTLLRLLSRAPTSSTSAYSCSSFLHRDCSCKP